jgi:two-component system alkaline phosphatase synthesis response regulator PhoP
MELSPGKIVRTQNLESNRVKKVLIIEDHADMRELLSWQVELMGFAPVVAKQARDGIEKALVEKPELIVLDIMMPGMDGWAAARELRAHSETKDIPILAATALFRDADLKACKDAGCDGYIIKPFTFQELQAKVQELIPSTSPTYPR